MSVTYFICSLFLSLVIVSARQVEFQSANGLRDENGQEKDLSELCKVIKNENGQDRTLERPQFVWKKIKSSSDIKFEEMVPGTFERLTRVTGTGSYGGQITSYTLTPTFISRINFNSKVSIMAKLKVSSDNIQMSYTVEKNTFEKKENSPRAEIKMNDQTLTSDNFEILTNPNNAQYKWIKAPAGTTPENAVNCGHVYNVKVHCGRMSVVVNHEKALIPVKIIHGIAHGEFKGYKTSNEFEYLVYV